jgi:hypothetical protein
MRGSVPRGCRLLINGASLLLEEGETNDDQLLWGPPDGGASHGGHGEGRISSSGSRARPSSWSGAGSAWGLAGGSLVCELSWMRFRALVDSLDLVCGIYVQERDASTASVQALVQLVNDNPAYLPLGEPRRLGAGLSGQPPRPHRKAGKRLEQGRLVHKQSLASPHRPAPRRTAAGFAYGHVRDRVLPYLSIGGRGYAGQELMEEFQAKQDLAREVGGRGRAQVATRRN